MSLISNIIWLLIFFRIQKNQYFLCCCLLFIVASQGFRTRSPLSSPLADWAGISDPRALDFYWMQLLLAASNQITTNNRSRKHHVCSRKCKHWAQPFYIYLNTNLLKAPIGQKWCHLCRLGSWKPLDGVPRELQNPAQSAKGDERGDRERNPWLAKMPFVIKKEYHSFVQRVERL